MVIDLGYDYAAVPKVAVPTCPVCGRANGAAPAVDRCGFAIGVSACACGLAYLNPRPTADAYATFYREWYRPLVAAYGGVDPLSPQARAHGHGTVIGLQLRRCGVSGGSLLDVGGGIGEMARSVAAVIGSTSVTVMDPNAGELAQATGCQTIHGLIETATVPQPYDVILCVQTSDHWIEPLVALRALRAALAPGGRLWIDIVEASEWRKRHPLMAWKIDHPLYWTRASFAQALQRTGWRVRGMWHTHHLGGQVDRARVSYLCEGVETWH